MPTFRKRPVEVQAFRMTRRERDALLAWPTWLQDAVASGRVYRSDDRDADSILRVKTLEGDHDIAWDDWIIQGIRGELYPCKPDIFEATYDAV